MYVHTCVLVQKAPPEAVYGSLRPYPGVGGWWLWKEQFSCSLLTNRGELQLGETLDVCRACQGMLLRR